MSCESPLSLSAIAFDVTGWNGNGMMIIVIREKMFRMEIIIKLLHECIVVKNDSVPFEYA